MDQKENTIHIYDSESENEEYVYCEGTIPEFVKNIEQAPIGEKARSEFYRKIAEPYMKNEKFRIKNHGKYALFGNDNLIGIYLHKNIKKVISKNNSNNPGYKMQYIYRR